MEAIVIYRNLRVRAWYRQVSNASSKEAALAEVREKIAEAKEKSPHLTFDLAYFSEEKLSLPQRGKLADVLLRKGG